MRRDEVWGRNAASNDACQQQDSLAKLQIPAVTRRDENGVVLHVDVKAAANCRSDQRPIRGSTRSFNGQMNGSATVS